MMRTATHIMTTMVVALFPTIGAAQSFDGYYMPVSAPPGSWRCNADFLGSDGGSVGIIGDTFFGVENTCTMSNPRPENGGIRYDTACEAEGEISRSSILIRQTAVGITILRGSEVIEWRRCGAADARASNHRWVSGFAMGVSEASTRDANGNVVTFSCNGGLDGELFIELGGRPVPGGPVEIEVDGRAFSMTAWAQGGSINTECSVCADAYNSLWQAVAAGNTMSVTAGDMTAMFDLVGSSAALGPIPCVPVGQSN